MTTQAIRHLALFWLKNPESAADRAMLVEGLETLRGIAQVKTLHIGMPAATEGARRGRSFLAMSPNR